MPTTVNDALKIYPLVLGNVIAGKGGLDREIKNVSVLEVPQATEWFKGEELLISAFYTIANDVDMQIQVLKNLNNSNCSGLILCHIGHWLMSISKKFIDLANELNFPIIIVPEDLAYTEIITPIMDTILNKRNIKNEHALSIYHKMADMLLDNRNIDHIIYSLSKLINRTVLFFNYNNECITTGYKEVSKSLISEIQKEIPVNIASYNSEYKHTKILSKLTGIEILFAPIIINTKYYGTIVILNSSDLSDLDNISINECCYICGLAAIKNVKLQEFKKTAVLNFYSDLIKWNFNNEAYTLKKALILNLNISKIALVLTIEISQTYVFDKGLNYVDIMTDINNIYNMLPEIIGDKNLINYIMIFENKVLVFINQCKSNSETQDRAKNLGNYIIKSIETHLNILTTIGIGNCYDSISNIKDSYLESLLSINIGNAIFGQPHCTLYNDIQLFSLLFENIDRQIICSVVNKLFKPLKEYDLQNNTTLVSTLKALIRFSFNTSEVSEKLFIHKNTVLQRKNKIYELLDYDPEKYPYRLLLELATILENLI